MIAPVLFMLLLFLEALGALCLLVFIVWWTMFSGRDKGELRQQDPHEGEPPAPPPPPKAPPG
ncbi:MAG: hypothetical protein R3E42_02650 [Burkholderiaceae bacterium]